MAPETIPNIVLFGASGCGKSSIINMLLDSNVAPTSSGASGCTKDTHQYKVSRSGQTLHIYDTPGLEEAERGSTRNSQAILKIYDLLRSLETGVNLLVFCIRPLRLSEFTSKNWILFHDVICNKKIPIIIVVTALETEANEPNGMDSWWFKNKDFFEKYGISPRGQACITSHRGKETQRGVYAYRQEYNASREKLMTLFISSCLSSGWKMPKEIGSLNSPCMQRLLLDFSMTQAEATTFVTELNKDRGKPQKSWKPFIYFCLALFVLLFLVSND